MERQPDSAFWPNQARDGLLAPKIRGIVPRQYWTERASQLQLVWGCRGCQNWAVVRRFLTSSRRRAGDHPPAPPGALAKPLPRRAPVCAGEPSGVLLVGALLVGVLGL